MQMPLSVCVSVHPPCTMANGGVKSQLIGENEEQPQPQSLLAPISPLKVPSRALVLPEWAAICRCRRAHCPSCTNLSAALVAKSRSKCESDCDSTAVLPLPLSWRLASAFSQWAVEQPVAIATWCFPSLPCLIGNAYRSLSIALHMSVQHGAH